jgi:hypothetical protein
MRTTSRLEYVEETLPENEGPVVEGVGIVGIQVLSVEPVSGDCFRWRYVVKRLTRKLPVSAITSDDDFIREGGY